MARHWLELLTVGVVCLVAGPSPDPFRSQAAVAGEPGSAPPPAEGLSARTTAVAAVTGAAAASATLSRLPTQAEFDELARTDPIALLDASRRRAAQLKGYKAVLLKQERVQGKLHDPEEIRTWVRADPYAVLMIWDEGAREVLGTATEGALFAAGENNGRVKVWRPSARLLPKFIDISPTDAQARASSRYSIIEGGLLHAPERTYRAWSDAKEKGRLHWHYDGTRPVEQAGGRVCHVVTRTCDPPTVDPFLMAEKPPDARKHPEDASRTVTIMIDVETWLQVGTHIDGTDGQLVAEYYFRDVELNPHFAQDQFKPSALRR